jgi:hypothetical protein
VRFDDRLRTILGIDVRDEAGRSILWAQIVDLLAQKREADSGQSTLAFERLSTWQAHVPAARRQSIARSVASPALPLPLVRLFARDEASIASPVLNKVVLQDQEWAALIPSLPVASRALLRERADLPAAAQRMLSSYGSSDFALSSDQVQAAAPPVAAPAELATSKHPQQPRKIADLVARIEAFQRERSMRAPSAPMYAPSASFRFECDSDGTIIWVEGVPRGSIIGMTIAKMAEPQGGGVDGHVAGAFSHRSEFRDGRLAVPGRGAISGIWLITASPLFDPPSGRFEGYRGVARRPDPLLEATNTGEFGRVTGLTPDSVRQLVHELRTPLNAIRGFGEMISAQLLGPVSAPYRQKAELIVSDAAALMNIFDDLESAARIDSDAYEANGGNSVDLVQSLALVARDLEPLSNQRKVTLRIAIAKQIPRATLDAVTCERMIGRLIGISLGAAQPSETIDMSLDSDGKVAHFVVERPTALQGISEPLLLDPSHALDGSWPDASPLGLAFTLRLIGNMARSIGGHLAIGDGNFTLILPLEHSIAGENKESF